jgi:hypothetical protein
MSESRQALLNKGLAFGSAFAALILLAVFYSVVSSAVARAESRRLEAVTPASAHVVSAAAHGQAVSSLPTAGLVLVGTTR